MLIFLAIGAAIALATVIMSYMELMPWLKAVKQLNSYTQKYPTYLNKMVYPLRWLRLLKLAWPVIIDVGLSMCFGFIGLNGGVIGALIGLCISFFVSCALKIHRHWIAPKILTHEESWQMQGAEL